MAFLMFHLFVLDAKENSGKPIVLVIFADGCCSVALVFYGISTTIFRLPTKTTSTR
jgi:hypothetical protein